MSLKYQIRKQSSLSFATFTVISWLDVFTRRELSVHVSNEMYAIHDIELKDWKFLEKKGSLIPLLRKVLPDEILKRFK